MGFLSSLSLPLGGLREYSSINASIDQMREEILKESKKIVKKKTAPLEDYYSLHTKEEFFDFTKQISLDNTNKKESK